MRRKTDKQKDRLSPLLLGLAVASSLLAIVIGYKAIVALDGFNSFIEAASEIRSSRPKLPEAY